MGDLRHRKLHRRTAGRRSAARSGVSTSRISVREEEERRQAGCADDQTAGKAETAEPRRGRRDGSN